MIVWTNSSVSREDVESWSSDSAEILYRPLTKSEPSHESIPAGDWDWILVTSRKAVEYGEGFEWSQKNVMTFSVPVAGVLVRKGANIRLIGSCSNGAELFEWVKKHIPKPANILVAGAEILAFPWVEKLSQFGFGAKQWTIYKTVPCKMDERQDVLQEGNVIAFASPSSVTSFVEQTNPEDRRKLHAVAIGQTTRAALDETFSTVTVAKASSMRTLLDTAELMNRLQRESIRQILFFDGVCVLCNSFVDMLLGRKLPPYLRLAPLQGDTANLLLADVYRTALPSVVLWENGNAKTQSDAALSVLQAYDGWWGTLPVLRIVPKMIRDRVYGLVARFRYKLFGRREACRLPTPSERSLFLP